MESNIASSQYTLSDDQPKPEVPVVRCSSWANFMREVESLDPNLYVMSVWRGQARSSDGLRATFFREEEAWDDPIRAEDLPDARSHPDLLLEAFKVAQSTVNGTQSLSDDRWWAIARHAGLKSPLLDWTMSPYVAAFFAFRSRAGRSDECAVFRLNWAVARNTSQKLLETDPKAENPYDDCLVLIVPKGLDNPPMRAQNGLFTRLYPPHIDIVTWVTVHCAGPQPTSPGLNRYGDDYTLTKYTLPCSARDAALDSLHRMNVHASALFPDLHGAAEFANGSRESSVRTGFLRLFPHERIPHI